VTTSTKSFRPKPEEVTREWLLVDANGMPMGRLASQVASILRGKHKPTYTPSVDTGDFVVVINSDKIVFTGAKMRDKYYFHHTGYVGGDKFVQAKHMIKEKSDFAIQRTVKGMLPKNSLGRKMLSRLKVYKDDKQPHEAQNPRAITLVGGVKNDD